MAENAQTTSARQSGPLKREGSGRILEESSGPRIAHTLTACCRCRTVSTTELLLSDSKLTARHRGRRDAMWDCHDADHASVQTRTASISIKQKARGSPETMSSIYNTRCALSSSNWPSSRKRTSNRIQRTWLDPALQLEYKSTMRPNFWDRQVALQSLGW